MAPKRDPQLGAFRIGDITRREVRPSPVPVKNNSSEPAASVTAGFPSIESRLEQSTLDAIADELGKSYEQLEALATGGDIKTKAAAKKAMAAYEKAADLFEYLFEIKATLQGRVTK